MRNAHWLVLTCALALVACKSKSTTTAPSGPSTSSDAGAAVELDAALAPAAGDDGGLDDGGSLPVAFCEPVDPAAFHNEDILPQDRGSGVSTPTDLTVTRQVVAWEPGCTEPSLRVELSDGRCPNGNGHQVEIFLPAKAIQNHGIVFGQNDLVANPAATEIRVRYTRPKQNTPAGVWTNCTGSNGQIVFIEAPAVTRLSRLHARFQLDLTSCGGQVQDPQTVSGGFNVQLRRGLADVCPGM